MRNLSPEPLHKQNKYALMLVATRFAILEDMTMQLVNKITTKAMDVQPVQGVVEIGDVKFAAAFVFGKPLLEKAPITPVARIFGRAASCKVKTSDFGESFQFNGNFEGVRLSDGEVFKSPKLFLPKVLESLMADALTASEALDFVVEIGVKFSKNAHHYEWTVKPLVESAAADQLAHLRGDALKDMPALLPAPTPEPATPVDTAKKKK